MTTVRRFNSSGHSPLTAITVSSQAQNDKVSIKQRINIGRTYPCLRDSYSLSLPAGRHGYSSFIPACAIFKFSNWHIFKLKIIPIAKSLIPFAKLLLLSLLQLYVVSNKTFHIMSSAIAALLIVLFVYTAINKLSDHHRFETVLGNSPLLKNVNVIVSWLVPAIELCIAGMLIHPPWRQKGLLSSLLLMCLFTGYIGYMIAFTPKLPCSCGGVLRKLSWKEHLVFNIIITLLALLGYAAEKRTKRFIAINRSR